MNDKEQSRLLGNLFVGGLSGLMGFLFIYFLLFIEPLGLGTVMYGLAGAMCATASIACLLLVRQQLTRWETTESNIELLRSRSRDYMVLAVVPANYHIVLPDQWQPIVAVVIALAAAFATIRLSRPMYKIIRTPSESQPAQA